jgi:hypothetical protein
VASRESGDPGASGKKADRTDSFSGCSGVLDNRAGFAYECPSPCESVLRYSDRVACAQQATRRQLVSGRAPADVPPVAGGPRRSRSSPVHRGGAVVFACACPLRGRYWHRFRSVARRCTATRAPPDIGAVPPRCERPTARGDPLGRRSRSTVRDPERGRLGAPAGGFSKLRASRGARRGKPAFASARNIAAARSAQKPRREQIA